MNAHECIEQLESLRRSEKEQALGYRGLAATAESTGQADLAQRFHDLHADEQHHLSRLTARVLELGGRPADLQDVPAPVASLEEWQQQVRTREQLEIDRYQRVLGEELDPDTRSLIDELVAVEALHLAELGGKWTMA